jgi:hypothetical protein
MNVRSIDVLIGGVLGPSQELSSSSFTATQAISSETQDASFVYSTQRTSSCTFPFLSSSPLMLEWFGVEVSRTSNVRFLV